MRKNFTRGLAFLFLAGLFLLPSLVKADVTNTRTKTLKAGQTYYLVDTDIKKNNITSVNVKFTPATYESRYDVIYPSVVDGKVITKGLADTNMIYSIFGSRLYIKSKASANSGAFFGIHVNSGKVTVTIQETRPSGRFAMKLKKQPSSRAPLVRKLSPKGNSFRLTMSSDSTEFIPVIFAGTTGTVVTRKLSDSVKEKYTFRKNGLNWKVYQGGKMVRESTLSYQTDPVVGKKTYHAALVQISASSGLRSTGYIRTTKGKACFYYPGRYLGIQEK